MNIDEPSELAKALPNAVNELTFARQRSRVVTADRLDVQMAKARNVDADAAFHEAVLGSRRRYRPPRCQPLVTPLPATTPQLPATACRGGRDGRSRNDRFWQRRHRPASP